MKLLLLGGAGALPSLLGSSQGRADYFGLAASCSAGLLAGGSVMIK